VLIQNAVFVFRPSPRDRTLDDALAMGLKLFAMKADLDARSVEAPSSVEVIGYDELVELITRHGKTLS
jgi:sulfur relay protein TusB/DsrH